MRSPQRHDGDASGKVESVQLGIELYRDIEDRWNRGKFGADFDACDDFE